MALRSCADLTDQTPSKDQLLVIWLFVHVFFTKKFFKTEGLMNLILILKNENYPLELPARQHANVSGKAAGLKKDLKRYKETFKIV